VTIKNILVEIFSREVKVNIKIQFIRFIINGIISAVGDILVLIILTELFKIHYLISAAIGVIVGTTINYYISIIWVFVSEKFTSQKLEFFLFLLFSGIGLLINQIVMFLCVSIILLHYLLAKFIALILVSIYNFLTKKYFVFVK